MNATTSAGLPPELSELPRFPSIDAFYGVDERRRWSPEWDYGVHWRAAEELWPRWRVSWVVATGDLYAARTGGGPLVLLLGNVPPVGEYPGAGLPAWGRFHREQRVEQVLEGWALVDPPLLGWILGRLALGDVA